MNRFFQKHKRLVAGLVLVVAIFAAYAYFFVFDYRPSFISPVDTEEVVGREILDLLAELRALGFGDDLFASPAFKSLRDFHIEPNPQATGKSDPFN